jgi:hypothetical protein
MKRSIAALVLTTALVFAGGALAQEKLDKIVKVGSLGDQSGLYADIGGPGSTVADRGRSPEQARRRRQHRPQLVRQRQGRRDLRRRRPPASPADLGARARRTSININSGGGSLRPHRRRLLAQHRALDLRHLFAVQRRRQGDGQARAATPGSSSPPTTPSAWRWSATPAVVKPTAARCWASVKHPLNTPTSRRSCCRPRPPRPRSSGWPMPAATPPMRSSRRRIRHRRRRPEDDRGAADVHHRRATRSASRRRRA